MGGSKMKIIYDVDGVFANFILAFNQQALKLSPGCLESEDIVPTSWNWDEELPREVFEATIKSLPLIENFWTALKPFQENCDLMNLWLNSSLNDIYFVTSRFGTPGHSVTWQTRTWIERFLGLNPTGFSVVATTGTSYRKAQFARSVGAEFSIDDKPGNVRKMNVIEGHVSYLLDRPYNQHADDLDEFRVKTVAEFNRKILDIKLNRS
jgi:hypothetical protein